MMSHGHVAASVILACNWCVFPEKKLYINKRINDGAGGGDVLEPMSKSSMRCLVLLTL